MEHISSCHDTARTVSCVPWNDRPSAYQCRKHNSSLDWYRLPNFGISIPDVPVWNAPDEKIEENFIVKIMRWGAIILALSMLVLTGCSKVPAGNVGVKVYLLGGDKGVESEELGVGRYWIGINEELYLFPTFTQNYVWTQDTAEGSEEDESISFQTVEGMNVGADVGISYHIDGTRVSEIFEKYRKGIEEITDIYLRNMVRDAFVGEASTVPVESVYGRGKSDLLLAVEARVKEQTEEIGIVIERIYFIGGLRLPDAVTAALDAKIAATQKAQQRQNEVAQAMAEADKVRAVAAGEADAVRARASAEAERIASLGQALRDNPGVVKLNFIQKWDGTLPRVMASEDGGIMLMLAPEPAKGVKK